MIDVTKKLEHTLGLTETEAAIYVGSLPYGQVGAADIVKLTHIKRTTVYHALDTLCYKGLVSKKGVGGKTVFSMVTPHAMQHKLESEKKDIEARQKDLERLIPELTTFKKSCLAATQVEHFQGVAGVKAVYEEALYCKTREWFGITPSNIFISQYGEDFKKYILYKRIERKIKSKVLWEPSRLEKNRIPEEKDLERVVRIMPKSMRGRFKSKIFLFDNKIALVTPKADAGAVLITSNELYETFKAVYDAVWEISKPAHII